MHRSAATNTDYALSREGYPTSMSTKKRPWAKRPTGAEKPRQSPTFAHKHYHRRHLLDDRVRNGNGYGQAPIVTGSTDRAGAEAPTRWRRGGSRRGYRDRRVYPLPPNRYGPKAAAIGWKKVVKPVVRLVPVS